MKYFLGFLAFIVLAVVTVVLISRGGPDTSDPAQSGTQQIALTDYVNSDAVVRLTIDGKIVAKEQHHAIRITVSRTHRTVEVLKGYDYSVEQTKQFDNDINAFNAFLEALDTAGFANEKKVPPTTDEGGVCPTGTRTIYEVTENNDQVIRLWSTSCSQRQGSFSGSASLVRRLFQAQIPEYSELTRNARL